MKCIHDAQVSAEVNTIISTRLNYYCSRQCLTAWALVCYSFWSFNVGHRIGHSNLVSLSYGCVCILTVLLLTQASAVVLHFCISRLLSKGKCFFPPLGLEKPMNILEPNLADSTTSVRSTKSPNLVQIGCDVKWRLHAVGKCTGFVTLFSHP